MSDVHRRVVRHQRYRTAMTVEINRIGTPQLLCKSHSRRAKPVSLAVTDRGRRRLPHRAGQFCSWLPDTPAELDDPGRDRGSRVHGREPSPPHCTAEHERGGPGSPIRSAMATASAVICTAAGDLVVKSRARSRAVPLPWPARRVAHRQRRQPFLRRSTSVWSTTPASPARGRRRSRAPAWMKTLGGLRREPRRRLPARLRESSRAGRAARSARASSTRRPARTAHCSTSSGSTHVEHAFVLARRLLVGERSTRSLCRGAAPAQRAFDVAECRRLAPSDARAPPERHAAAARASSAWATLRWTRSLPRRGDLLVESRSHQRVRERPAVGAPGERDDEPARLSSSSASSTRSGSSRSHRSTAGCRTRADHRRHRKHVVGVVAEL